MEIKEEKIMCIKLNKKDMYFDKIRIGDLIMYKGDTFKVFNHYFIDNEEIIKLFLVSRATNFYVITSNNGLFKVADYYENSKKENEI